MVVLLGLFLEDGEELAVDVDSLLSDLNRARQELPSVVNYPEVLNELHLEGLALKLIHLDLQVGVEGVQNMAAVYLL